VLGVNLSWYCAHGELKRMRVTSSRVIWSYGFCVEVFCVAAVAVNANTKRKVVIDVLIGLHFSCSRFCFQFTAHETSPRAQKKPASSNQRLWLSRRIRPQDLSLRSECRELLCSIECLFRAVVLPSIKVTLHARRTNCRQVCKPHNPLPNYSCPERLACSGRKAQKRRADRRA